MMAGLNNVWKTTHPHKALQLRKTSTYFRLLNSSPPYRPLFCFLLIQRRKNLNAHRPEEIWYTSSTLWAWGEACGSLSLPFICDLGRDTEKLFSSIRNTRVQPSCLGPEAALLCWKGNKEQEQRDCGTWGCVPHLDWSDTRHSSLLLWSPESKGLSDLMLFWEKLEVRIFMQHFLLEAQIFPEEPVSQNKHLQTKFIHRLPMSNNRRVEVLASGPLHMPCILPVIFLSRFPSLPPS